MARFRWIALLATILSPVGPADVALPEQWSLQIRGGIPQAILVHPADPRFLVVALKGGGVSVYRVDAPTRPPARVASISRAALGNLDAMNLAWRGTTLFVALGDFFAATGSDAGLASVDLARPAAPRVVGRWRSPTRMRGSATVAVDDRHAYLGAMRHGVLTFDAADPARLALLSTFQPDPGFPRERPSATQHPNARGLAIVGDRLFVAYDAGGLRVLDVSDRAHPREIGRYVNAGMRTKQQAYNNVVVDGRFAYVAVDYAGLEVIDVADPAAMRPAGWWNPWKADTPANMWFGSPGHTNQIEIDRARRVVYLSAGDSELQVVDVSNPRAPVRAAHYGAPGNQRAVWGLGLGPDAVYLAYIPGIIPFRATWTGLVAVSRPATRVPE